MEDDRLSCAIRVSLGEPTGSALLNMVDSMLEVKVGVEGTQPPKVTVTKLSHIFRGVSAENVV